MNTPTLNEMIKMSKERVEAMTDREKDAMVEAQRESFVRGEMGFGSDRDETRERGHTVEHQTTQRLQDLRELLDALLRKVAAVDVRSGKHFHSEGFRNGAEFAISRILRYLDDHDC